MLRKLFLTTASLFLVWQSWKFAGQLYGFRNGSLPEIILVAWVFNLFVTGIFAFAGFAHPTERLLPDSYYHVSKPGLLRRWYHLLRVDWFRRALLATLWRGKDQGKRYFNGRRDGVANLRMQSMKSEFGHLLPFILLSLYAGYLAYRSAYLLGAAIFFINVIGNLYPVLLQRYHRMRLQRLFILRAGAL
ncbi:MAG: hypothetical protein WA952_01685 [Lewinella sp.]